MKKQLLTALIGLAVFGTSVAQTTWPTRPVRIVVPEPAGSVPDFMARLYAVQLGK
ncbi:MAG: hypothetical protein Q7T70_11705 [Polaromonas sp.]|nr:hypothetical protein [Polaromonas sp.]